MIWIFFADVPRSKLVKYPILIKAILKKVKYNMVATIELF